MKKVLFALMRVGLGLQQPQSEKIEVENWKLADWYGFISMVMRQGMTGVVFDGVNACMESGTLNPKGCSEDEWQTIVMQWQAEVIKMEMRYQWYEADMVEMAKFFNSHDMPYMVIKGYGLSLDYPHPDHRPTGDLDVWFEKGYKVADKLIHDELGIEIDNAHHHHTVYTFKGLSIENHYDFVPLYGHKSNHIVEDYLQKVATIGRGEMVVKGEKMQLPSPAFNAIFLLRHAAMHFAAAEIQLRHVTDWAMFVNHFHDKIEWNSVYETIRKSGMEPFANALCGLCVSCLGMPKDWFPMWKKNVEEENKVLKEIMFPAFNEEPPKKMLAYWSWMWRRWWQSRWKHKMVYSDSIFLTFFTQVFAHLMKPATLKHG